MLAPAERRLLTELLVPPTPEHRLDHALATTFTLDLTALLPLLLGFAGNDASAQSDQMTLLQCIRDYTDRLDVFCQAGSIAAPTQHSGLLEFLGPVIHQVGAPKGGLFHPKLWLLRFASETDDERVRLICGSRNITHDHSWDTVLTLDGRVTRRRRAMNNPLADFVHSLPERVPVGMGPERQHRVDALAENLRFVEWEPPEGISVGSDWLTFHIFGQRRRKRPDMSGYKRLVVSPFVNSEGIELVWPDRSGECHILSRVEELNKLDSDLQAQLCDEAWVRVVNDDAAIPAVESDEAGLRWPLTGLHSKLFIVERARRAHLFVGSANATGAAWTKNDEILVEIEGSCGEIGVECTVGDTAPLRKILIEYEPGPAPEVDENEDFRWKLQNALRHLATVPLTALVDDRNGDFIVRLESDDALAVSEELTEQTQLTIAPLTATADFRSTSFGERVDTEWNVRTVEAITPFFSMSLTGRSAGAEVVETIVVLARLIGEPADRLEHILASQIKTPSEFMRFVLLLLSLSGEGEVSPDLGFGLATGSGWTAGDGSGLLEAVLTALARSPYAIDEIDRFANGLEKTERGRELLPGGWEEFWPNVMAARDQIMEQWSK